MSKIKTKVSAARIGQPQFVGYDTNKEERRWAIARVCERYGVDHHPSRGVGKLQPFIDDLLEEMLKVNLEDVKEVVREVLTEMPDIDRDALRDAIKERLEADTGVRLVDRLASATELFMMIANGQLQEVAPCPLCGAPALGGPSTTDARVLVSCSDAGPGCTMPPVDRVTWERFPRADTITTAALEAVAKGVADGWDGNMYEREPTECFCDAIMSGIAAKLG